MELMIIKRLVIALVLGAIIGYERERAHKVAGLRTHILVCVSSALIALVALYGFQDYYLSDANRVDSASRIISNIIIGIGFIGGGAILRREAHVMGTTTAATLWTVAAIGIAVGVGFTYAALAVTLIGYLTLTFLWRMESKIQGSGHQSDAIGNENGALNQ